MSCPVPSIWVHLMATPIEPRVGRTWLWAVVAEEMYTGVRHTIGPVTCEPAWVADRARALARRERPDLSHASVVVEPTP